MAATEAKDLNPEIKKPTDDVTNKVTGVDLTKAADSQLATPQATSKAATDLLPTIELVGKPALLETQPLIGSALVADTRKGATVDAALPALAPEQTTKLPEQTTKPAESRLSPEAINANVDLVKDKLTNYLFLIGAPDTDALARTLGPMAQADRQALEAKYQEKFGKSLRDELKYQLGSGEKFVTIEAMLNRKDGATNLAGNARIALEVMKEDPERGMRLLRSTLAPLNSSQAAELQANYQKDYGKPLTTDIQSVESSRVGENQKAIFSTLLKGVDKIDSAEIVDMAKRAVQSRDLQMFAGVIGGDLPANVQARAALNSDPEFVANMRKSFGTTSRGRGTVPNPIAEDYLREGRISLGTILKADTSAILPYFQNAANSDLVFSNATGKERRDYASGRDIVKSGAEPKTIQEQEAKRFFEFIEKNIQSSASGTRREVLRDQLLHGGKTLISGLAELHKDSTLGFGGGHTTNDLMKRVENMTAAEWNLLKNPTYKANFAESLKSYATADEQKQVLALIEAKLNPPGQKPGQPATFEQSQAVERPLEQYMQNFTASAVTKTSEAVGHIERMTAADASRYQNDPAFKASVDSFASKYLTDRSTGNIPAQLLASRLLEQTAQTGKPPVLGELDQFLKTRAEKIDSDTSLDSSAANKAQLATIGKVEELMKDPALLARMQNVLAVQRGEKQGAVTREDDLLYKTFTAALGTPGNFAYLLTDGKGQSYIGTKVALSGGLAGDWLVGRYPDLAKLPEADRNRIRESLPQPAQKILDNVIAQNGKADLTDNLRSLVLDGGSLKDFQADLAKLSPEQQTQLKADYSRKYGGDLNNDLFSSISKREGLSPEKQQVLRNTIAQNGQPQLVDQLRSFVLGDDKKFQDFQSQLATLTTPQKQELKSEYQKRYGGTLDNDFLGKVDAAHSEQYSRYLTASNTDGMQSFFDRMNKFAPLSVGDGTSLGQERMLQVNEGVLKQFNANMEKLPPAVQEALAEYYSKTYQNNLDSNEKYAHFVADVTLTTASIAAAIALAGPTGGLSMAALATREGATLATKLVVAGATAGAIARPTMIAAMKNGTFDYSAENLTRQGLIGAVQGALIAPIGLGAKVGIAAKDAEIAASTIARETAEQNLSQRLAVSNIERQTVERQTLERQTVERQAAEHQALEQAAAPKVEQIAVPEVLPEVAPAAAPKLVPQIETAAVKETIEVAPVSAIDSRLAQEVAQINPKTIETAEGAIKPVVPAVAEQKVVAETIEPAAAAVVAPAVESKVAAEALSDQATAKALAERAATERAATERAATERAATERIAAERAVVARTPKDAVVTPLVPPLVPPVIARTVVPEVAAEVLPKPEPVEKETKPEAVALKPSDNLIQLATVRRGEGPWQSAERILATDGKRHSVAEVRALTRAIQATFKNDNNGNGDMSGLKVKYNFVTEKNFEALINAVQDQNVKNLLIGLANQNAPSNITANQIVRAS
ncbi:MAG: hypothetical protein Q8T09_04445 [Candidatus Melainabacteria bacterium]|nr:hypothetical protein [Candidatus Melainabacteria bacterium]